MSLMEMDTSRPGWAGSEEMQRLVRRMLELLGEDPDRDGLSDTPERVAKALRWLTRGYRRTARGELGRAIFQEKHDSMVLVKDIELYSLCEHHMLPFFGRAHVAYIPDGRIVGLSKLARLVDAFARRLQVQERLTAQVADCVWEHLKPQGVAVVIEASHACMTARGVHTPGVMMTTSRMMGVFREDQRSRREVLALMGY